MREEIEESYTLQEVAAILKVDYETLRRGFAGKGIGYFMVGRQYRIPKSCLVSYCKPILTTGKEMTWESGRSRTSAKVARFGKAVRETYASLLGIPTKS